MDSRLDEVGMQRIWSEVQAHPDFAEGFRAAQLGEARDERGTPEYQGGWSAFYDCQGIAAWVRSVSGAGRDLSDVADGIARGHWIPGYRPPATASRDLN